MFCPASEHFCRLAVESFFHCGETRLSRHRTRAGVRVVSVIAVGFVRLEAMADKGQYDGWSFPALEAPAFSVTPYHVCRMIDKDLKLSSSCISFLFYMIVWIGQPVRFVVPVVVLCQSCR